MGRDLPPSPATPVALRNAGRFERNESSGGRSEINKVSLQQFSDVEGNGAKKEKKNSLPGGRRLFKTSRTQMIPRSERN